MHATVARITQSTVRIGNKLESRFAYWSVRGDEKWNCVGGPIPVCDSKLGIGGRARSAGGRLSMAPHTTIQVKPRTQPRSRFSLNCSADRICFRESTLAVVKELLFLNRQTRNWSAGASRTRTHPWIGRAGLSLRHHDGRKRQQQDEESCDRSPPRFLRKSCAASCHEHTSQPTFPIWLRRIGDILPLSDFSRAKYSCRLDGTS